MAAMRPETEGSVLLSLSGCVCSVCSTPVGSTCRHQTEISSATSCKYAAPVLPAAGESIWAGLIQGISRADCMHDIRLIST